jgi:hypothetical protein
VCVYTFANRAALNHPLALARSQNLAQNHIRQKAPAAAVRVNEPGRRDAHHR